MRLSRRMIPHGVLTPVAVATLEHDVSSLDTPTASTAKRVICLGVKTIPISFAPFPYLDNSARLDCGSERT